MEHLLRFGLSNAAAAAVLAVLAALATRVWRNPHFAYALWLVVLLRLVAPPLLPVGLPVPEWMAESFREPLPVVSGSEKEARPPVDGVEPVALAEFNRANNTGGPKSARRGPVASEPDRPAPSSRATTVRASELVAQTPVLEDRGDPVGAPPRGSLALSRGASQLSASRWPSIANLAAAAWLSGTLCYLLLTVLRVRRFARVLRRARRDVPAGVAAEAAEVAAAVGLRRVPWLAFAEAALPPMVCPEWRPVVLLPETLFTSLGADERRLLLWHEFLHLRRRDHLVRWFEVGVVGLYWWNPVAWWAVARLQQAEEDCCDAAVLVAHPHESARYGETLVSVAQFLSTGTLPTPSLSLGVARNGHIKRRLTMILHGPRWPKLSRTRLAAFSLLGAALVAVTWTAAKAQTAPAAPAVSSGSPSSSKTEETDIAAALAEPQGARIDEILVEGNMTIPAAAILQNMKTQAGGTGTLSQVQEDIRTLIKTRWFLSVVTKYRRTEKKLTLVLVVVERPIVHSVVFLGATQIKIKKLAAETGLKVGSPYDMGANKEAARHLENFYHEQGYTEATVDLIQGDKREQRDVVFRIHEGVAQKVVWRYFVGNQSVSGERLAMELKSTPAYVFSSGQFEPANLTGDVAAVRKYYANLGFFDATVAPKVEYRHNREWIYLKYTVHEGPHYKIRNFSLMGNVRFKSDELLKTIKKHEGQFYNAFQIRKDLEEFKKKYEALGHTHLNVEIVERFPKQPGVIDLLLRVEMAQNEHGNSSPSKPAPAPNSSTPAAATKAPINASPFSFFVPAVPVSEKRSAPLSKIEPMQPAPGDDELRKLQKQRFNAALSELELYEHQYESNTARMNDMCKATRNLFDTWTALAQRPADTLRALDWYVGYTNSLWNTAHARLMAGGVTGFTAVDEAEARAAHFEAEIESMKRRQALTSKTGAGDALDPERAKAATEVGAASTPRRPIETAIEARHESVFTAVKRPSTGSRFLLDLMYPKRIEAGASDDETRRLLKEKYNAASRAMQAYQKQWETGSLDLVAQIDNLLAAARNLRDAELAFDQRQEIQLGVLETYLDFTRYLEQVADGWVKAGGVAGVDAPLEAAHMRGARADAELRVHNLQRDMAQREVRNPPAFLKAEPANNVPSGNSLPALLTAKPLEPAPGDDERLTLLKKRYNAALRLLQASYKRHAVDPMTAATNVLAAARRVLAADLALISDSRFGKQVGESHIDARQRYFEFMKYLEREAEARFKARMAGQDELEAAHEARLDSELELLEAKQKLADRDQSRIQSTDAAVVVARAELDAAKATVERRKAELNRQTAHLAFQKIQYDRINRLLEQKAIEARLVTEQRDKRDAAAAAVEAAKAALDAAQSELSIKQVRFDQLAKLSQTK